MTRTKQLSQVNFATGFWNFIGGVVSFVFCSIFLYLRVLIFLDYHPFVERKKTQFEHNYITKKELNEQFDFCTCHAWLCCGYGFFINYNFIKENQIQIKQYKLMY